MAVLDILVILIFLLLFILLNIFSAKQSSSTDFIIAGRQLSLPLFVATLVSTWYGDVIGVTHIAFSQGIYNLFIQGVLWYIAYICFALLMVKVVRDSQAISLSDWIRDSYGKDAARITAYFMLIKSMPITYIIGIGVIVNILTDLSINYAIIIAAIFLILFAGNRSMKVIAMSDTIQFVFMFGAVISMLLFSVYEYGGIAYLATRLEERYFNIQGDHSMIMLLIWFIIAFSTTFTSPIFYQRCLAACSSRTAKTGIFISIIFWCSFDICTTLGAMYAKAAMPDLHPSEAYIKYGMHILPAGAEGFFISGILATIISTLDSFLMVTTTTILYDIIKQNRMESPKARLLAHSAIIILSGLLAILHKDNIENIWIFLEAYCTIPLMTPILAILLKYKISSREHFTLIVFSTITIMTIAYLVFDLDAPKLFFYGFIANFVITISLQGMKYIYLNFITYMKSYYTLR